MKKIQLSVLALFSCSSLLTAGGDITTFTPYVEEEINVPVQEVLDTSIVQDVVEAPTVQEVISAPVVQEVVKAPVVQEVLEEPVIQEVVKLPVEVTPKKQPTADVSPFYLGLGVVAGRYDSRCLSSVSGCDGVEKSVGLLLRAGYDYNQYIGAELRGISTFINDNDGKIQHYGAFVKPMYPMSDDFNLYGLLGFAKTKTSGNLRVTDVSGFAYGLGLEYDLSDDKKKDEKYEREFDGLADQEKGLGLFVDYEKLYYKSNAPKLDAISLGVTYDF